jgi:hypothetical protein
MGLAVLSGTTARLSSLAKNEILGKGDRRGGPKMLEQKPCTLELLPRRTS